MEGPEIQFAEAEIDNGRFGTRTVRFETGRLAQQAAGSAVAYLDGETMLLSATTVGKHPKDHFDFFPLTVDVEERMYAAGRIPGSFFRREGRPSTEAILACRLIDRPLRPLFVKGVRNEVQVVVTVLAAHPDDAYDTLAINAASLSTQLSGLPFSGPAGAVRIALIDGQWVAFPKYSDKERAVFDMVVSGRIVTDSQGNPDVAIAMIEAEATDNSWNLIKEQGVAAPTESVVAEGIEAAKPFIRQLCEAQADLAARATRPTKELPLFPDYQDDTYSAVENAATAPWARRSPSPTSRTASRASTRSSPRSSSPSPARSRAARRSSPPRTALCRRSSSVSASSPTASASTAVASRTSAPWVPRSRSCRACTARRCSSAARPRSWVSPR
ncbi:hypothetical protein GCM10025865_32070 [Paraoerskovia sediminicola]|uniref:Exoribonuclease phosphorolytic domain-containing protein n=1 Tax=Paraoerskovia sediminicola TaxID=1138587 RepID=A0ABN6XII1_9CELL|nr:hypothetical protein GCM10025865_32070 [Paraoerskovia sediminicola]